MFASGLSSGIDTRSLVRQLVQIERQPLARLEAKGRTVDKQISQLGGFATKLDAFGDTLDALREASGLLAARASSSEEDSIGVTARGGASEGSWTIEVDSLARRAVDRSAPQSDAQAAIRAGTMTITAPEGDPFEITIPEGATLAQVRDLVRDSGAPVDVSVVNADAGSFLSVTAQDEGHPASGEAGALVIEENYTGTQGAALGMSRVQDRRARLDSRRRALDHARLQRNWGRDRGGHPLVEAGERRAGARGGRRRSGRGGRERARVRRRPQRSDAIR